MRVEIERGKKFKKKENFERRVGREKEEKRQKKTL